VQMKIITFKWKTVIYSADAPNCLQRGASAQF
jgi:hypothetical protein